MASLAQAAVLPTNLEPMVGPNYQPADSEERDIWQSLARVEQAIRASPQRVIAPELDAYLRSVIERLIGRPAPDLRIYVIHDASLNAAMLPNGMMIVNTGLLARVRNEAQLAAVLGHEAGHYFRRHALDLQRDSRRIADVATAAASSLHSFESYESLGAWSAINQAILLSSSRFSRDLESEADAYGLMLMARAGYPPRAAAEIWSQFVDERRASAAARHKRYSDGTSSAVSTHPPTATRMTNLLDTAESLSGRRAVAGGEGREGWTAVIGPYRSMLLHEQICLNDPGGSLYLIENLAKDGWTGLLRFNEGEVYRLRNAPGDGPKAAAAYAAAVALADVPPEAWRAQGYARLKAGEATEASDALNRYLAMTPDAPDAAMIRLASTQRATAEDISAAGSHMTVNTGSGWKRLASETRWADVWTWSGPQLDRTTVLDGLPGGKSIAFNELNADQQVPAFHADMTTHDLTSMLEVSYRIHGVTVFEFESVEPADFLGGPGVRLRYHYTSGVGIEKRGDCVMRVVGRKLYAMKLESVAGRAFDRVSPEFDRLLTSAQWRTPP